MIVNAQQLKQQWGTTGNTFNKRIKYHLKHHKLFKLRKGLYSDVPPTQLSEDDFRTLGGFLYTPSYLSYETILYEHNIISQRNHTLTFAWPYSKQITIEHQIYHFRRLPMKLLLFPLGLKTSSSQTYACVERAICDILYHHPHMPFDYLPTTLDTDLIWDIAQVFSQTKWQKYLLSRIESLFSKERK